MARWSFTEKRNLTLLAFSTRMFFMGVEYAVIFPSVWLYLKIFHVDYWYLGLVLSAYNMVGIVSTSLVGHLVDVSRKVRVFGFVWNLAEISGNFIYSMPFWVGLPLIGRMVAGFGEGYISAMWGELARVTTPEQRTRYFAILKGSNLLGAALGPAFNLFLKEINFSIGEWRIDFRTSPGFIMGLAWIVVTALMLFFVFDLSWEMKENPQYQLLVKEPPRKLRSPRRKKKAKRSPPSPEKAKRSSPVQEQEKSIPSTAKVAPPTTIFTPRSQPVPEEKPKRTILSIANEEISLQKRKQADSPAPEKPKEQPRDLEPLPEDTEPLPQDTAPLSEESEIDFSDEPETVETDKRTGPTTPTKHELQRNPFESPYTQSSSDSEQAQLYVEDDSDPATFKSAILDMFTKFHVVVMVYLLFFMYIIHTCLQGITPLIAEIELHWNETQVSILYTVWGLEIILVLVVVWLISPKISDRIILLFAVICACFSSLCLIILSYSTPGSELCLYSFILTILLAGVGISVTVVIGRSLVSKHTKSVNQGLVHAILTSFNRIAGLSGPIFGSSLYTHKTVMGWILAFLQVVGLVLLLFAYNKLKVVKRA